MTTFTFANNASTTLAAAASSSATTMTLAGSTNFPSSIPSGTVFPLTLNDAATRQIFEIVYVTAIAGTTITVERGQEGTAAQNWNIGDFAFSGLTAGVETALGYGNGQTYAADTGTANAYVVTLTPPLTAHMIGRPIVVKIGAGNSSTGASTFNPGPGAVSIVTQSGAAITNQIAGGGIYQFVYDGTHYQIANAAAIGTVAPANLGTLFEITSGNLTPARFASANQTIATNTTLTIAHGLGAMPFATQIDLVCLTAQGGFSANQIATYYSGYAETAAGLTLGIGISRDATNIYVVIPSGDIVLFDPSTQSQFTITPADWAIVARAWL